MSVTFIVRAEANDLAPDCGIQPPGSYLDHTYQVHCFDLDQRVEMTGLTNKGRGPRLPFRVYAKAPFVVMKAPGFHPQVVQPGVVQKLAPAPPRRPGQ